MRDNFRAGHVHRLQCLHGDRVRCNDIARELCMSYLYFKTFRFVRKLSSVAEFNLLLQRLADLFPLPPMLIWFQGVDLALMQGLQEELEDGTLKEAHVLLTCNNEAADVSNGMQV